MEVYPPLLKIQLSFQLLLLLDKWGGNENKIKISIVCFHTGIQLLNVLPEKVKFRLEISLIERIKNLEYSLIKLMYTKTYIMYTRTSSSDINMTSWPDQDLTWETLYAYDVLYCLQLVFTSPRIT